MSDKENEVLWSDAAIEAAKKAKAEAEAKAAASGGVEPPPNLDQLVALTLQALARGKSGKEAASAALKDVRSGATLAYERAINGTAKERFQARYDLLDNKYPTRTPAEAKGTLETLWKYAETKKVAPTDIIASPKDLNHSPVAMEYVSRLTTLQFNKDVARNPMHWWEETMRAYESINFHALTDAQERELRGVFEKSFAHMRALAKKLPPEVVSFPEGNDRLWRGLGDYYFTSGIAINAADSSSLKAQKIELRSRLRALQDELSSPHRSNQEQQILDKYNKDLREGLADKWPDLKTEVDKIQYKLTTESEGVSARPESGGGPREENAEARAKAGETLWDWTPRKTGEERGAGFGLTGIDQALHEFYDPANPSKLMGVRAKLKQLDDLFVQRDFKDRWDPSKQQANLRAGIDLISDIERERQNMTPEQVKIIEGYNNALRNRAEYLSREGEPPNRLYLTRTEAYGLENDPIGTVERMYLEAMKAFGKDPDGPLAKFYLDRLELMEYYLFSRQHGEQIVLKNFSLVIANNKTELDNAVRTGAKFRGEQVSETRLPEMQLNALRNITDRQKENLERSFTNRFHEILFMQQWKHAASANDEQFQRFLNSRMLEDDFWGMDRQFGGLLKKFRMTLARKYEAKLFDAYGDRNAHVDRLWDTAILETEAELRDEKKYADYKKTWDKYINGDYFTDNPDSPGINVMKRATPKEGEEPLPPKLEYSEAVEMITQFASFRMEMSQEKYLMDMRFLPVRWGKEIGRIYNQTVDPATGKVINADFEFTTQFYEKQKIAKLANSFEAWMITWGGITSGMSGEEQLMMRNRAKILRKALPEINDWGKEWAHDWMESRVGRYKQLKSAGSPNADQAREMKRIEGEMKALFSFTADPMDNPSMGHIHDVGEWIQNMSLHKLQEETTFYAAMRASAMTQGLTFYMGVSESGARRDAQMGALKEIIGDSDIAKQNFLTHVDVSSSRGYFQKKLNADTHEIRKSFLDDQAYIAKYSPHSRLLALREGNSAATDDWIKKHDYVGGKAGFAKFYEDLARYHENIYAELALEKQIDYGGNFGDLTDRQHQAMDKVIGSWIGSTDKAKIRTEAESYFNKMHAINQFLTQAGEYGNYAGHKATQLGYGALSEMTDVRFGQIMVHMRRDDYLYEYVQDPTRAVAKLSKIEGHALYGKTVQQIRDNPTLRAVYLTRASDKFEPTNAQDEQSGLWRRNWRDVGAAAGWWDLTADRWSMDDVASKKARQQTYKAIVGVNGNDIAKISDILDDGQRLAFQEVYASHGAWFKGMYNSSDIKRVYPHKESRMPDDLWHQYEQDSEASGGLSRRTALGAMGMEYALKDALRVSYFNKWTGGMVGREELVSWVHKDFPFLARFINEKNIEDLVEWADHTIPLPLIWQKFQIGVGMVLLIALIYSFQSAGSEEKKKGH